jgi:hypothetical protein
MYNKHAVWCQCATVFYFTFALSIISSFKYLLLDTYWGLFFLSLGVVRFCHAEHAPLLGIRIEHWIQINRTMTGLLIGTICSNILFSETLYVVTCQVIFVISHHFLNTKIVLPLFVLIQSMSNITLLPIYCVLKLYPINNKGKSMASIEQKLRFAKFSLQIILETLILWSIRCSQRFPYNIRWKPILCSFFILSCVLVYCHFYIKPTNVSRNSIITRKGHGMTASLTAVVGCELCTSTLILLDMESSFGD